MAVPLRILILFFGVLLCSTAVIFIKLSTTPPLLLASLRTLGAALILLPLYFHATRLDVSYAAHLRRLQRAILPGLMLGAHFASWVVGARMTPAANSSLIVNMVPIIMPLLVFAYTRERVTRAELLGTAIALAGMALLIRQDFHFGIDSFIGDIICFISMLFYAWYLAMARVRRTQEPIWAYVVPVYTVAALATLLCAVPGLVSRPPAINPRELLWIAGLIVLPTVGGHSILNFSMRVMRSQTVTLVSLIQVGFVALLAWPVLGELPRSSFYPAVGMIVIGAAIVIRNEHTNAVRGDSQRPRER